MDRMIFLTDSRIYQWCTNKNIVLSNIVINSAHCYSDHQYHLCIKNNDNNLNTDLYSVDEVGLLLILLL